MSAVLIEEPPNPDAFIHRVKVALTSAGFMQVVMHEQYGSVVCAGYNAGRGRVDLGDAPHQCRLDYSPQPSGSKFTQQQRMKILHAMCNAYSAVLEAAGFTVQGKVGPQTGRPYIIITEGDKS